MKYDILVKSLVNEQAEHIFVQHHGISEGKVENLFNEVVQEQYDRLERGKPLFRFDTGNFKRFGAVIMSRTFEGGDATTIVVAAQPTNEVRHHWEAQEHVRKGESQA